MISRNSSRLVFFLRPLYSMSVNVPCFTSFTALICWLYYITFYRFVHGFDQSEVPFVIPFSSWQIITLLSFISNTFVSFFSVAFHQSPCFSCQFFMSVFPILHGFFIRFSFFIIGQIKYKVGQPFLKRWILLAHMVA